jgi:SAM-dependent methyltransferase
MPKRRPRPAPTAATERFGPEYYRRFYGDARTRVSDAPTIHKLATFVAAYLRHLGVEVRTILDIGCGMGHWRTAAKQQWPRAKYQGVEFSEFLCQKHGWTRGSVVDFEPLPVLGRAHFDLVVCQGVLQYLDDRAARRAIRNLARWTGRALYLEALTAHDWRHSADRTRTDGDVHRRTGAWYRRELDGHFTALGGGVFVKADAGVTLFELEAP